jgi:hypothetical protein
LITFRNAISAVADSRSLVATIIPYAGAGNSMPVICLERTLIFVNTLVAGLNSLIVDYVLRQKACGGNLNYYVLKQLPFPAPELMSRSTPWDNQSTLADWFHPRVLELTYTAWDLQDYARSCLYEGAPFRWDEGRRFLIRCEVDAAYFQLFEVTRNDVDYIMDTFPIVKRRDEEKFGEYRTKRVILEIYDAMTNAISTGFRYQTLLTPPPADPHVTHALR